MRHFASEIKLWVGNLASTRAAQGTSPTVTLPPLSVPADPGKGEGGRPLRLMAQVTFQTSRPFSLTSILSRWERKGVRRVSGFAGTVRDCQHSSRRHGRLPPDLPKGVCQRGLASLDIRDGTALGGRSLPDIQRCSARWGIASPNLPQGSGYLPEASPDLPQASGYLTGASPDLPQASGYLTGASPNLPQASGYLTGTPPNVPEASGYLTGAPPNLPQASGYLTGALPDVPEASGYLTGAPLRLFDHFSQLSVRVR